MKTAWIKKWMSVVLTGTMLMSMVSFSAYAEGTGKDAGSGKYVSDVFIAYGKTEKDAQKWLKDNGWEPVEGDFNAGKASFFDDNQLQDQNVAAVMGIKRTDKANEAVTDMAVMNMKGGYSIGDYESLVEEKKAQINEFINHFQVVIDEYRANYNGEGSAFGKERADLAYSMLNKFTDGGESEAYPVNDTGMKLGDLFLAATRQEGDEKGGDLEQLMLESSGPAMLIVETFLALGADAGGKSWLTRASGLTGDEISENLLTYVPEAEGQDVSDSAATQLLEERYGDTAARLAEQWDTIHETMAWYQTYTEENGLWRKDGEEEAAYADRIDKHFTDLGAEDDPVVQEEQSKYRNARILYGNLYEVPYTGEWGESMGDFFNPADGANYGEEEYFLPMAAALSQGQKASLDFLSLNMLLMIGFGDEEAFKAVMPQTEKIFGEMEELSIYTGVNRAAFRGGVALTSEALMEQNAGKGNAYDMIWDNTGIVAISSCAAAALSIPVMIAGGVMISKTSPYAAGYTAKDIQSLEQLIRDNEETIGRLESTGQNQLAAGLKGDLAGQKAELEQAKTPSSSGMGTAGRWILGVGGTLLIAAAIVKGIQMWQYYDRDMTPIPLMVVDEADVVSYVTDEKGEQKKNINFDTYAYYTAVKCNRPDVGEIGDWQSGVEEYKNHNCFDVADLNADMGQEWVALYTVKSSSKGYPILADSLTLQYGSDKVPDGCTKPLHLFTYSNAVDLGDTAWAFNNGKNGVYLFWDEDTKAFPASETASAFGGGQLALAGIAGLALGIIGSTLALRPRRKERAQAETTD